MAWVMEILAYTASAIDCEGCIRLSKEKDRATKNGYCYRLIVEVDNTNEVLGKFLQDNFGGWIYPKPNKKKPNHKILYQWIIDRGNASTLLKAVLPYLLLKRHQAELAIAFQSRRKVGVALTEAEKIMDDKDYEAMRILNKRGID